MTIREINRLHQRKFDGRISLFEREKGQKMSPLTGLRILMDFYYIDVAPTVLAASH